MKLSLRKKKAQSSKHHKLTSDEMHAHYDFDYSKAKPNRFAGKSKEGRLVVILDEDVAKVFTTPETVNNVLRALISTMPATKRKLLTR